ncbi:hypothetical protein L249_5470 [Ophiocordyceps polyrhachis-furcata BCC 54312]|uniref:Uncharacterized protein n=1 Tax=Ophiocordyceps polyrhachis-furcata BCC 54312 TaxID=1330021 RepID=A0A367LGP2_9HYPO|nr:hypothetical protein L249_5470 [Ophiocordyceps polyrhachis-furcata BCC 54312]
MSSPFSPPLEETQLDFLQWHPNYLTCLTFFLGQGQEKDTVRAVAAFVNIKLPSQRLDQSIHISLVSYIRRLVATGFDSPSVLQDFFGDCWVDGIGPLHQAERRNYLFAAKSETWLNVKSHYDMEDGQSIPFLRPLFNANEHEIVIAESKWSEWLAMQDWMLGPRAPPDVRLQRD